MKQKTTSKADNLTMVLLTVLCVCLFVVTLVTNSELAMGAVFGLWTSMMIIGGYTK